MNVAIYCRVSTDEQNIKQQQDVLIQYCKNRNWKYRSYIDDGISGQISNRPAWQSLLKDCEKKQQNTILVLKIDRITRSLEYAIDFYKWQQKNQIKLYSLYDNVDLDSPDGYFTFMLKCLLSEYELIQLDLRRKIGIERAKKEGKYKGGKKGRKWKAKKD